MKTHATSITTGIAALAALALLAGNAAAQEPAGFPARSVRLVVPFSVGGASDIMARVAAPRLTEAWGHQVVVDNRTGADGRIATELVAKSVPDGYTLLVVEPAFVIAPGLFAKLPFDVNRDFAPVVLLGKAPQVFVVHPSFPARTVKEFIAIAKARPDDLNFASPGNGSAGHLAGEQLRTLARIQFVHIPYKGAAPALVDLLAGQASFAFVSVASALTNVKGGKLRALAVTTTQRFAALPETPTLDEAGVKGFDTNQWWGVVAPAATPKPVVTRLNADFVKAMNAPEARERVSTLGAEVSTTTVEGFGVYLADETAKWGKIVRASGAKAE